MLEDIQERFVYRTHIYIRDEILNYNPSSGDIAYPEKLEIMEKIAAELRQASPEKGAENHDKTDESFFDNYSHVSPADVHGMWYPTVKRTLICLSKLHRCLDVTFKRFK